MLAEIEGDHVDINNVEQQKEDKRNDQGNYECEVWTTEAGAEKEWLGCTKNPGHQQFIPAREMTMDHLPDPFKDEDVLEYVRLMCERTARICVWYTSKERPDGYAFANYRGKYVPHYGSGIIYCSEYPQNVENLNGNDSQGDSYVSEVEDTFENNMDEVLNSSECSRTDILNKSGRREEEVQDTSDKSGESVNDKCDENGNDVNKSEKSGKYITDKSEKSGEDITDTSEKSGEYITDKSEKSDEDVKNKSEKSGEDITDKSKKSGEDVKDKAEKSGEDVKDTSQKSGEDIKDKSQKSGEDVNGKSENRMEINMEGTSCNGEADDNHDSNFQMIEYFDFWSDPCRCPVCSGSDEPCRQYGYVFVNTAKHVVFDKVEGLTTTVELNYDEKNTKNVIKLHTVGVLKDLNNGDWITLVCVTHDRDLYMRLYKTDQRFKELMTTVHEKFWESHSRLSLVVSHPHGWIKHVTICEWVVRKIMESSIDGDELVRYTYNTATCKGSSGAPVLILGMRRPETGYKTWLARHHVHCGAADKDTNISGIEAEIKVDLDDDEGSGDECEGQ